MAKKKRVKPPREPLGRRVGDGLNALGELGRTAANNPRDLPRRAEGLFRRWFRKVWEVRGGGLYATGFALTFLYLEIVEIVTDDVPKLFSTNLMSSELIGLVVDFVVDTFVNFVQALIWPVQIVSYQPPWGIAALVVAFILFNRFLTPVVENWMNRDDDPALATAPPDSRETGDQEPRQGQPPGPRDGFGSGQG